MKKNHFQIFLVLFILFVFLRLLYLRESINFSGDQGLHLLDIYNIFQSRKIPLIGPPSSLTVNGRSFFAGAAPYYLMLPILFLANWNPLSISYLLIFLYFLSTLFLVRVIYKKGQNANLAIFYLCLMTFLPPMVSYSRFLWHPNFLVPITSVVLALMLLLSKNKKHLFLVLTLGILLGLGLEIHYSYALAVIVVLIWFLYKVSLRGLKARGFFLGETPYRPDLIGTGTGVRFAFFSYLALLTGIIIGFFPIIIFELRHNFYNFNTFLLYLSQSQKNNQLINRSIPFYYFLSVFPFILYAVALLLNQFYRKYKNLALGLLTVFVLYCFFSLIKKPQQGFLMVKDFNYDAVVKMSGIIAADKKEEFNIVDILTGDSRALALRYLLTIKNHPPMDVISYPRAKYLYVYARIPIEEILAGSMWETDGVKPAKILNRWQINNDIYLYLLQKDVSRKRL